MRRRQSRESKATGYYTRAIKRIIRLVFWLFVLFLIIVGVYWAVPKIWNAVFG